MAGNKLKRRPSPANPLPVEEATPAQPLTKAPPAQHPGGKAKQGDWSRFIGFASLAMVAALFAFQTFLVAVCGMAPAIVAVVTEERRSPFRAPTIFAANFAAVIPYIAVLWERGHRLTDATRLLSDPYVWAAMYSGAIAGMALLWLGPVIAASILSGLAGQRRRTLDVVRKRLLEEWGDGLLSTTEPDQTGAKAGTTKEV